MAVFSDLYLDYQRHPSGNSLLWPVWIWTLHVPERRRDGLNVLALTVLRLHAVGCDDPGWIGEHLGVDEELIRYIIAAELIVNGLLDQNHRLTKQGNDQLQRAGEAGLRQRVALMFQSAESELLWPRQIGKLQEIEPIDFGAPYPSFLLGRETGHTLTPFRLSPASPQPPPQLTLAEFRNALWQDRIARRQRRLREGSADDSDSLTSDAIELIDPRPRPAWVLCRAYKGPSDEHPWLVSDPLGQTRAADWMRKEVFEASRRVPALAKRLAQLLGEVDQKLDWQAYRRQENEMVQFEVFERFPDAGRIPGLEERLIELLRVRATVEGARDHQRSEEIGNLIIQCQRTLEQCLLWQLDRWPLERPGERLGERMQPGDLRHALRCAVPGLPECCISDLRVSPKKVYGALRYRTGSLRQYLAGVLLSLADHSRHPFRALALDERLMRGLIELSADRDAAGHGSDEHAGSPDRQVGLRHANTALEIVSRLIEGIPDHVQEKQGGRPARQPNSKQPT